jgi:hypothetical protein
MFGKLTLTWINLVCGGRKTTSEAADFAPGDTSSWKETIGGSKETGLFTEIEHCC